MCKYCERQTPIGWNQPPLPYHDNLPNQNLLGNIADFDKFDGRIYDYQTATPELILTCPGYFNGEGTGTIYIPIKYCPECGEEVRKANNIN